MGDLRKPMAVAIENEDGFVSRPRKWAKIDYLAERQNRPCRGVEMKREMIAKINHRLHELSGLEVRIDYLAERQNDVKNPAFSPMQLSRILACENEFAVRGIPRGVGKFIFAKLRITLVICGQINPGLHGLHPKTPLETATIDYLAERQNGPWGEELTPEEDAERRESGN